MQKVILSILGAGIFYLGGAVTVQYKLFPYPQIIDLKNGKLLDSRADYLKNNQYAQQVGLYNLYQTKQSKIVMLGDSITFGANWNELLDDVNIINRGIGSDITNGFIHRLENIYKLNPKYVFIMGGINDIAKGYKVDKIFKNYKIIIEKLKSKNIRPIVQSTLFTTKSKHKNKVKKLNLLLMEYCKNNKIDFINLNDKLSKNDILIDDYTNDGVHLKPNGYEIWKKEIEKYLLEI
ncbi:MAG TPA: GDSL family lipase [Bacteroidia bacterium]|nr:GDSL family lipase [Bacteroidia bacterium]